jgi:hypothetical protein
MRFESEGMRGKSNYLNRRAWYAIAAGLMAVGATEACEYVVRLQGVTFNPSLAHAGYLVGFAGFLTGVTLLLYARLAWHGSTSGIMEKWNASRAQDVRRVIRCYSRSGAALLAESVALIGVVWGLHRLSAGLVGENAQWLVSTLSWVAYLLGGFCAAVALGLILISVGTYIGARQQERG